MTSCDGGIIEISSVEHDGLVQDGAYSGKIRCLEFFPLCGENQRVCTLQGLVSVVAQDKILPLSIDAPAFMHGFRVVGLNSCPGLPQRFHYDTGGSRAHIVGIGLERQSPQREGATGEITTEMTKNLGNEHLLLEFISPFDRSQNHGFHADLLGGADQCLYILGKARTAIADAGIDEMVSDPWIGTDAATNMLYVGSEQIGKVRNLVHQADLGRQHAVGGIFGQFGAAHIHADDLFMVAIERRIEFTERSLRLVVSHADDYAIGLEKIGNG